MFAQSAVGVVDDRVRRAQLGARRRGGAGRRRAAARAGDGAGRRADASPAAVRPPACRRARSASATSRFAYPGGAPGARPLRPHDPRRLVARHRRAERRRQDDARQAAVPAVRPAGGRDRGRRRRPARARARVVARARRPPCSRTSPASSCRCATTSRRRARPTTRSARRSRRPAPRTSPASTRCWRAATTGGTDLSGGQWQRVALARALCAVRARRRRRAARRADRAARRARRGGDLRAHPRRDAPLHDDPHLAPLLDRAPRRPHLRARDTAASSSSARTTS